MMHLTYGMFLALLALLICHAATTTAFLPTQQVQQRANTPPFRSSICAQTAKQDEQNQMNQNSSNKKNFQRNQKRNRITIGDLKKEILRNPSTLSGTAAANKSKKNKRTRRKVENPQQKYVYAAQRIKLEKRKVDDVEGNNSKNDDHDDDTQECSASSQVSSRYMEEARRMGLTNPLGQHCDPLVDTIEPELVGRIRVGEEENGSGTYAYIINKPQGWSILGGTASSSGASNKQKKNDQAISKTQGGKSTIRRVKIMNSRGKEEFLEFDEADVMALLSPEERAEIESRGGSIFDFSGPIVDDEADFTSNLPGWYDVENMTPDERKEAGIEKEDYDPSDILDFDEADIVALLSPEELLEYEADKKSQINRQALSPAQNVIERYEGIAEEELDPSVVENLKRIKTRLNSLKDDASFSFVPRPSIVSWLKDMKAAEGSPIRGGNFWTALAGASEVDDTGLVLLAPKEKSESIFVEFAEYISVVGTGNYLNNKAGKVSGNDFPIESVKIDMISRLKRNREGDTTQTIRIVVSEHPSTCAGIIAHAQNQFEDGIRGDPAANVFDRRAPRRLIHCASMAVSSLLFDDTVEAEAGLPDDIAILSERLNNHKFLKGSFLGRQSLRENPLTTAYREINGAADGFPGWTIDRYGDWLLVQHDEKEHKGPLPSIHDGYTAGVYLLPSNPNRGSMGSNDIIRPYLLEGKPAPDVVEILENGIKYHVSLDRDLSTGIFLDQRAHRAWLSRYCNSDTHVLNCFAHCGAFSVAAATAGASTVSMDLNKKWLDRIQPQLEANGIEFDERHDCIYGDCFEWIEKLGKRGEKFDIVILDPPSSSVGKKKRRWSVKNDMEELVQLAAPLVKSGGLLWTTTNSASIHPLKFANQCRNGLENAGIHSAKLERIQPMSVDFPTVGPQPVKNLVWRIN